MLGLVARLFGRIVEARNAAYDNGRRAITRTTVPVVSVGNLSVGGTGKTPVVHEIVRIYQHLGMRPAIVARGYRSSGRGLRVVHDGTAICCSVDEAGDEAFLHAQLCNVPVVVHEQKSVAADYASRNIPCDVIIVDDGFQHRALARAIDVVLVDRATINGSLMPAGRLREPRTSLRRADIVLTMGDVSPEECREYTRFDTIIASCKVVTKGIHLSSDRDHVLPLDEPIVIVAGIAQPERVRQSATALGYDVRELCVFPDHHQYTADDVRRCVETARRYSARLVTTEKDLCKLIARDDTSTPHPVWYVLAIHADISDNRVEDALLAGVR
jgi:tetraacyldisaccharide 4'-kinase